MTKHSDIFTALAARFRDDQVKVREENGRRMHYVTERTVANRLDDVLGPENWWPTRTIVGDAAVHCVLTIRLPDGSLVAKDNVGTGRADRPQSNPWKAAFSDSLKRAAAEFGVARYLYRDGVPDFVREATDGKRSSPAVELEAPPPAPQPRHAANGNGNGHVKERDRWGNPPAVAQASQPAATATVPADHCPRSGKALFGWVKDQEQRHQIGLLKYLNGWAKLQEFPGRMIDWDMAQVELAYDEACRKLRSIESQETPE